MINHTMMIAITFFLTLKNIPSIPMTFMNKRCPAFTRGIAITSEMISIIVPMIFNVNLPPDLLR